MTKNEIVDYLTKDLKISVLNDVKPCLQLTSSNGGYFAVPRLTLSYVDYLGALYNGYSGLTIKGRRVFATSSCAKAFLENVFGTIDPNYKIYGALLWEIYRNGTIHLYAPLTLENQGKTIEWSVHKGQRTEQILGPSKPIWATHLVPIQYSRTGWLQPISIVCLYEDLLSAIDEYAKLISENSTLEQKFKQVADALQIPEHTSLKW